MKICFISLKAYPIFNPSIKATFGGAEVQLSILGKELSKKKQLKVNFMVADYGQEDTKNFSKIKMWKVFCFSDPSLKKLRKFLKIFNQVDADVYVQRALTAQSGLIALYCRFKKKKFIYMVAHDRETDGTHELYSNFLKKSLANLTFKYAHKVIVQNEYQKKEIAQNYNRESQILNSSYEIKETKSKKTTILWVGRSEERKRPELFLELAKLNPKESFVMICPPSTNNAEFSEKVKEDSEKIGNLEFHSFVPFNEIDKFFQKSKIYVTTSEQEGFQNTLIQATKNSTPLLSLNVNPNNFITKYNCGFFCDDDFKIMNKNLQKLLKDKKLYNEMSKNAYGYAKNNHDVRVNVEKFFKITM